MTQSSYNITFFFLLYVSTENYRLTLKILENMVKKVIPRPQ